MKFTKLKKWLGNLPIFGVRRSDLKRIGTILSKQQYEKTFKYYLGKHVDYNISTERIGFVDVYVYPKKKNWILSIRYDEMKKFIEKRYHTLTTLHYA